MFNWFKKLDTKKILCGHQENSTFQEVTSTICWDEDVYKSVCFLLKMYVQTAGPFAKWQKPNSNFTPEALPIARLCTQNYQLMWWFWMLRKKFDPIAERMVRDAFILTAYEMDNEGNFSEMLEWFLDIQQNAYSYAKKIECTSESIPEFIQISYEYYMAVYFYLKIEDSPYFEHKIEIIQNNTDVIALTECLIHAKEIANYVYNPMQDAYNHFTPTSIEKWRWGNNPGAHEMHLQRRHNCLFFSVDRQGVNGADVYGARIRDAKLFDTALAETLAIRKELQENELPENWKNFLRKIREQIDELMDKVLCMGKAGKELEYHLLESRQFITNIWMGAHKNNAEVLHLYAEADQMFFQRISRLCCTEWLRQLGNPELAIPPEELTSALLTEEIEDFTKAVVFMEEDQSFRQSLLRIRSAALNIVKPLIIAGYDLPDIHEKLDILGVAIVID